MIDLPVSVEVDGKPKEDTEAVLQPPHVHMQVCVQACTQEHQRHMDLKKKKARSVASSVSWGSGGRRITMVLSQTSHMMSARFFEIPCLKKVRHKVIEAGT